MQKPYRRIRVTVLTVVKMSLFIAHSQVIAEAGALTVESSKPGPVLQAMIDAAPPHSAITFDRNETFVVQSPVYVRKPIALHGLRACLPDGLGKSALLIAETDGFTLTDFDLRGNGDTVSQDDRSPLVVVRGSDFRIENGTFRNSSKDGVKIDGAGLPDRDIIGGVVRDISGFNNIRDTISISGGGDHGRRIRNVIVENVRAYDSARRGAVEVSDGTDAITVRDVHAERCVYAVDFQDHGRAQQVNTNVLIENVRAIDCTYAILTSVDTFGHENLSLRYITALGCATPLYIAKVRGVSIADVRISGHHGEKSAFSVVSCGGVSIRDIVVTDSTYSGSALFIEDSNDVAIDGVTLGKAAAHLQNAVAYRIGGKRAYSGLRIENVTARHVKGPGILVEAADAFTSLSDVTMGINFTSVSNRVQPANAARTSPN